MIVGESFVFLHPPKTGGSFVTEALTEIYGARCGRPLMRFMKHGGVEHIPSEHVSKQFVTLVRNPFEYYVSHYHFGYWIHRQVEPWLSLWNDDQTKARFPTYPYLTFREFMEGAIELGSKYLPPERKYLADALKLGPLTVRTLQFSVRNYIQSLEEVLATGETDSLKTRIKQTRFLHTESLNQETYQWLIDLGVPDEAAAPVLRKAKVQPLNTPDGRVLENGHGRPRTMDCSAFFDNQMRAQVVAREWLFLKLFPEYTI